MNQKQIEELKSEMTNLARMGRIVKIPGLGVEGKVIGVGFKPYWTNVYDSKIDKLELNIMEKDGRIIPININYVVGYKRFQTESKENNTEKDNSLEVYAYSSAKSREKEPYDKVCIEVIK